MLSHDLVRQETHETRQIAVHQAHEAETRRFVAWNASSQLPGSGTCRTDTSHQRARRVSLAISRPDTEAPYRAHSHGRMPHRDIRDQEEDMNMPSCIHPPRRRIQQYLTSPPLPHSSLCLLHLGCIPRRCFFKLAVFFKSQRQISISSRCIWDLDLLAELPQPHTHCARYLNRSLATLAEINPNACLSP